MTSVQQAPAMMQPTGILTPPTTSYLPPSQAGAPQFLTPQHRYSASQTAPGTFGPQQQYIHYPSMAGAYPSSMTQNAANSGQQVLIQVQPQQQSMGHYQI